MNEQRASEDRRVEFLLEGLGNLVLFTLPMIAGAFGLGVGKQLWSSVVVFVTGALAFTATLLLMRSELRESRPETSQESQPLGLQSEKVTPAGAPVSRPDREGE